MALGDPYATPEELADRIGTPDDGSYMGFVYTATRMVDAFTGRQFNKTEVASERRFRALDLERLPVDDFHTLDDLVVVVDDATLTLNTDFEPRPFDGVVNGLSGWPFYDLMGVNRYWPIGRRRATIEVTAQWGWAEVPIPIVEATLRLANRLWDSSGSESGRIRSETISGYSVSYEIPELGSMQNVPPELIPAIPYRRKRFGVA